MCVFLHFVVFSLKERCYQGFIRKEDGNKSLVGATEEKVLPFDKVNCLAQKANKPSEVKKNLLQCRVNQTFENFIPTFFLQREKYSHT